MAVTLNFGTTGYDIFVNIWQSNNYSSYHYDPAVDVGHSRIYQMEKGPGVGAITQVTGEPLSYQGAGTVGVNGPPIGNILAFCRDYYLPNRLTAGRKILIVPCAIGGTGFSSGNHWGVWLGSGHALHEDAVTRVNAAVASLSGSVIKACFCHGGEADAFWDAGVKPDGSPGGYPPGDSRLAFIDYTVVEVADFRARWTGGSGVPFFFGQMSPKYWELPPIGLAPGFKPGSLQALEEMASHVPNSVSVSSLGLTCVNTDLTPSPPNPDIYGTSNFIHFDAESQRGSATQTNPWSKRHWTAYQTLVP